MRKLIILFVSLLMVSSSIYAGDQCTAANSQAVAFTKESITVSTSVVGLTAATYNPALTGQKAIEALVSIGAQPVRIWFDGSAPTSTVGHLFVAGQSFNVCQAQLGTMKMIRDTSAGADATASVTYFVQQ